MPSDNINARLQFEQGRKQFSAQDYGAAADHFKSAIRLDPKFEEAHRHVATCYERLNYQTRAKRAWEGLHRILPEGNDKVELKKKIDSL